MRAEIISSGTELLLGEVLDTNTPYLARELAAIGIDVYHHITVGDNPNRLLETMQHAEKRVDIVIVSGGLGPTQDDITKDILSDYLELELIPDKKSIQKIKERYHTEKISKENQRQSQIIKGAKVLENDVGLAAGMLVKKGETNYVLLPGPPNEFEPMVSNYLIPYLEKKLQKNQKLQSRHLKFYGLAEATIAEKLDGLIENQTNPTIAVYAKQGIIDIRITASGAKEETNEQLLDQIECTVMDKIGQYFIGYQEATLSDIIFDQLEASEKTLSVLEFNINSHVTDFWENQSDLESGLKASFHFSDINEAQRYFNIDDNIENKKSLGKQNEDYAWRMKEQLGTDYALAVSARGIKKIQGNILPEKLYMSIVETEEIARTKVVDFSRSMYFVDWVIPQKISDFVRRYLLSIKQLEN